MHHVFKFLHRYTGMEHPKVSVCIPTYNHEAYVAQAIESALAQRTNFRVELIVGEDCSTDGTRRIVVDLARRHPEAIRLRLAKENQGAGRNFVDLFAQCRGKYVVILEGDDYWTSPDKLQTQVDALDGHPQWAMCFHPAMNVYDDGRPSHLFPEERTKSEYTIDDLLVKDFMATSAVMFRNRLFGKLPDWFAEVVVGDWALHILNAMHGNIGFLPEPMSVYRIHSGGLYSSQSTEFKLVAAFKMLSKMDHHLGGRYTDAIDENRLHAVRWLVGQWEHEAEISKQLVAQAAGLASRTQLEFELAQREVTTEAQIAHAARIEAECGQLRSEMLTLKSFYDVWHESLLFRVYRETVRPWRRLRRRWRSAILARRQKARPSEVPTKRNAA